MKMSERVTAAVESLETAVKNNDHETIAVAQKVCVIYLIYMLIIFHNFIITYNERLSILISTFFSTIF